MNKPELLVSVFFADEVRSAWAEGSGTQIAPDKLKAISPSALRSLYESQDFLPSAPLDEIDQYL